MRFFCSGEMGKFNFATGCMAAMGSTTLKKLKLVSSGICGAGPGTGGQRKFKRTGAASVLGDILVPQLGLFGDEALHQGDAVGIVGNDHLNPA